MRTERQDTPGLKKLRKESGKAPKYSCANCKCMRYSPCTCQRKRGNK